MKHGWIFVWCAHAGCQLGKPCAHGKCADRPHLELELESESMRLTRSDGISSAIRLPVKVAGAILQSLVPPHSLAATPVPGASVSYLRGFPTEGFTHSPFGTYPNAFANCEWDAIALQPTSTGYASQLSAGRSFARALRGDRTSPT